jgi:2-amino-4-hydroxy-6-hydroxymethyldihydropteridine diphosphokinase
MTDHSPCIEVFLSLGSNLGDREGNLTGAALRMRSVLEGMKASSIYESAPLYVSDQPAFLNAVISGCIRMNVHALLEYTQEIERAFGREMGRKSSKGPRPLDIDILLFGDHVLAEDDLVIPHPGMKERKFVLVPLLELAPEIAEPVSGIRYVRFLEHVNDQIVLQYRKWDISGMPA